MSNSQAFGLVFIGSMSVVVFGYVAYYYYMKAKKTAKKPMAKFNKK